MITPETFIKKSILGIVLGIIGFCCWLSTIILIFVQPTSWQNVIGAFVVGCIMVGIAFYSFRSAGNSAKASLAAMTDGVQSPTAFESPFFAQNLSSLSIEVYSEKLAKYIKEVEALTGQQVHILDRRAQDNISERARMPNDSGPPPFYLAPDYTKGIVIYATPDIHAIEETESAIANVLTLALLSFEGFPKVAFNPSVFFVGAKENLLPLSDIDAIQKWLYNALLNLVAEERIVRRGFFRRSVQQDEVNLLEQVSRYHLTSDLGSDIFDAINLACVIIRYENQILPPEWGARIDGIKARIAQNNPSAAKEFQRILKTLKQHNLKEPQPWAVCFKAILHLWDIDRFVMFGYLNPRTGQIEDPNAG